MTRWVYPAYCDGAERRHHVSFATEWIRRRTEPFDQLDANVAIRPGQVQRHLSRQLASAAGPLDDIVAHVKLSRWAMLVGVGLGKKGVQFRRGTQVRSPPVLCQPSPANRDRAVSSLSSSGFVQKKFSFVLSGKQSQNPCPIRKQQQPSPVRRLEPLGRSARILENSIERIRHSRTLSLIERDLRLDHLLPLHAIDDVWQLLAANRLRDNPGGVGPQFLEGGRCTRQCGK